MATVSEQSSALVARLESLPFSRWHRTFFLVAFFGTLFDAADFALFGGALPLIRQEYGLTFQQAGLLATVGLVGAFVGALFWGTISDYIGRRTAFSATVGIFAVFTGLVASSWSVASLAVFRFLSNFGLGGEVPVASTLTVEFMPGRIRGSATGSMMTAFPIGLVVAVVPAFLLFFVARHMPESVRYLLSRGRIEDATRTVEDIERRAGVRPAARTAGDIRPEVA